MWHRMRKPNIGWKLPVLYQRREPLAYRPQPDTVSRGELEEVESRMAARLDLHGEAVSAFHRAITDAFHGLRTQLTAMDNQLVASLDRIGHAEAGVAGVKLQMAALERKVQGHAVYGDDLDPVLTMEESAATQLMALEETVKSQAAAIESARSAIAVSDDLIERIIDVLASLDRMVAEEPEARAAVFDLVP